MPQSMRAIKLANKGNSLTSKPKLQSATTTTKPTSVMPISVTSHESTETVTTYVNGRAFNREEVTKIYVIEPVEQSKLIAVKEGAYEEIREKRWLADLWLVIWGLWVVYLAWEWMR